MLVRWQNKRKDAMERETQTGKFSQFSFVSVCHTTNKMKKRKQEKRKKNQNFIVNVEHVSSNGMLKGFKEVVNGFFFPSRVAIWREPLETK